MLVLSRKEAERIRLGDSIVVTIVKIAGDKVRIGIEAPSNVLVLRDELTPFESRATGGLRRFLAQLSLSVGGRSDLEACLQALSRLKTLPLIVGSVGDFGDTGPASLEFIVQTVAFPLAAPWTRRVSGDNTMRSPGTFARRLARGLCGGGPANLVRVETQQP